MTLLIAMMSDKVNKHKVESKRIVPNDMDSRKVQRSSHGGETSLEEADANDE
jgi:hypothetical protein